MFVIVTNMPYICCMNSKMNVAKDVVSRVWCFYRDGFKNMTWGRTLWLIIFLKLFVLFVVLRLFFFRPALEGLSEKQKSEQVGKALSH